MEKLNAEQKEKLASEILDLLKEYELNGDLRIYYDNKCLQGNGVVIDNIKASSIFEYATDDTLSMTFEGGFFDVINYYLPSLHNEIIPKFTALLQSYGLYYEQGHDWNLATFYIEEDDTAAIGKEQEGTSYKNPIYIRKDSCPNALELIRSEWEKRQLEHGEDGTCVLGAGFRFRFNSLYYKLPPQGPFQGSISWEASKDIIQSMLIAAGCEEVSYDYGRMD